jgi:multiple sugar transport system ATP-binding protein
MAGVTLKNIGKSYDGGPETVRDVSIDIADGEFCVFVGPSGCGKSTLLRMIAGLENITSGELRIGGQRVNDLAPSERNIAMVFQNYALYPHMDVAENIGFGLGLAGVARAEIKVRVAQIAQKLQITPLLGRKPRELSGGQRQRVAIGRAMVREPGVFLFDEPLSNLDAALRAQTRVEIARLHRQYARASTIYVTHDQVEAMTLADKIVLLHTGADVARFGSVAQAGAPLELYANPRNLFVAGFIGSPRMNFIKGAVTAIDNAGVTVRTATGQTLQASVQPGALAIGAAVTLGARSEHLQLQEEEGANTLACRVQWVERLGDITYAYLDMQGGEPLVVRAAGDSAVSQGDAVRVRFWPQCCHLFDSDGVALTRMGDPARLRDAA